LAILNYTFYSLSLWVPFRLHHVFPIFAIYKESVIMNYQGKKAAFYTLGCKLNFSETSSIAGSLKEVGFERVEFDEKADLYVINTCSVTNQGDKASRNIIRQAVKQNPGAM